MEKGTENIHQYHQAPSKLGVDPRILASSSYQGPVRMSSHFAILHNKLGAWYNWMRLAKGER